MRVEGKPELKILMKSGDMLNVMLQAMWDN